MSLTLLYESGGVLAVAKPAGLATQAPAGVPSVEAVVRERLFGEGVAAARAAGRRRHPGGFLGVPHRLDRAVSGVLLLATTPRAARQLARQFERREIRKTYLALVTPAAAAPPAAGTAFEWKDTLRKLPDEPRAEIVIEGAAGGREAVTTGQVLAPAAAGMILPATGTLLLQLEPLTGRMHQLRVQAAARGLPIVGDTLYGGRPLDGSRQAPRAEAIGLHAWRITFHDPATATETTVTCPLPSGPPWPGGPT
jgi:23S rRNA pseudouridine1911/1915/1917 synthase